MIHLLFCKNLKFLFAEQLDSFVLQALSNGGVIWADQVDFLPLTENQKGIGVEDEGFLLDN
jgi:ABC-type phosphate transport system substrate-binding protein